MEAFGSGLLFGGHGHGADPVQAKASFQILIGIMENHIRRAADRRKLISQIIAKDGETGKQLFEVFAIIFCVGGINFDQFIGDGRGDGRTIGRVKPDVRVNSAVLMFIMMMFICVMIVVVTVGMFVPVIGFMVVRIVIMVMVMITFTMLLMLLMLIMLLMCAVVVAVGFPTAAFAHLEQGQAGGINQFKLMTVNRQGCQRFFQKTFEAMRHINHQIGILQSTCFAGAQRIGMRGGCPIDQQSGFPNAVHQRACDAVDRFEGGDN